MKGLRKSGLLISYNERNRQLKKILEAWSRTDGYDISPEMNKALEEAWLGNLSFDIDPEMTKALQDTQKTRDE